MSCLCVDRVLRNRVFCFQFWLEFVFGTDISNSSLMRLD